MTDNFVAEEDAEQNHFVEKVNRKKKIENVK